MFAQWRKSQYSALICDLWQPHEIQDYHGPSSILLILFRSPERVRVQWSAQSRRKMRKRGRCWFFFSFGAQIIIRRCLWSGLAWLSHSWEILPAGVSSLSSLPPHQQIRLKLTFEKIETKNNVNWQRRAQSSPASDIQWLADTFYLK